MEYFLIYLLISVVIVLAVKLKTYKDKINKNNDPIFNLEQEIFKKQKELSEIIKSIDLSNKELIDIKKNLEIFSEENNLISSGFYDPKYDFNNSKSYIGKLENIRNAQKILIKNKQAITCSTSWTIEGSKEKGQKMIDRIIKLGLSAFNVQCENEILKVRYDNVSQVVIKIHKIRDNINKLLEHNHCIITKQFLDFKIEELYLVHEYQEKLQSEKEEQKRIKEQMREEEKALRELQKAQEDAEKDERNYQKALDKAKEELAKSHIENNDLFLSKIKDLEQKLKEAQEIKERAKSQAQLTKQGYVYIISNIGSFGENVYKIGMTRRLDPMDRIWELGDASVPFDFDVHAMIYCENAPELENKLHNYFTNNRINKINERKEFFKVSLDDISKACKKILNKDELKITMLAEAKEYKLSKLKDSYHE